MAENSIPEKTPRQLALDKVYLQLREEREDIEVEYQRALDDLDKRAKRLLRDVEAEYPEAARDE